MRQKSGGRWLRVVCVMLAVVAVVLALVSTVEFVFLKMDQEQRDRETAQDERIIAIGSPQIRQSVDAYVTLFKATLENDQVVLARYDQRQRDIAADCEYGYTNGSMPGIHDVKIEVKPHYIQRENGRFTLGVTMYTEVEWNSKTDNDSSSDKTEHTNWSDDHVLTFIASQMAGLEDKTKVPYIIHDDETLPEPDSPDYKPLKDLRKWDKK